MPFNLLILPLLGGYLFVTYCNWFRYVSLREEGQRLIFRAASTGVFLLITARAVVEITNLLAPDVGAFWKHYVPLEYSGTAFLAWLIGACAWWPANVLFGQEHMAGKALEGGNDPMELLFFRALQRTLHVELTLRNDKVYVGLIVRNEDPASPFPRKSIELLPVLSGYRDPQERQVVFTTNYGEFYERFFDKDSVDRPPSDLSPPLTPKDFTVVVPAAEILSARIFDKRSYDMFQDEPDSLAAGAPGETA